MVLRKNKGDGYLREKKKTATAAVRVRVLGGEESFFIYNGELRI